MLSRLKKIGTLEKKPQEFFLSHAAKWDLEVCTYYLGKLVKCYPLAFALKMISELEN